MFVDRHLLSSRGHKSLAVSVRRLATRPTSSRPQRRREIRRVRIERAKRELVEGTRSIKDIARETGFGSSLRMYEVFLREVGLSPSDSREQRGMDPKAKR